MDVGRSSELGHLMPTPHGEPSPSRPELTEPVGYASSDRASNAIVTVRAGEPNNHWLDGLVSCAVAPSIKGAVPFGADPVRAWGGRRLKLPELREQRRWGLVLTMAGVAVRTDLGVEAVAL